MLIPNWPAPKNVKAFASTRAGGFSNAPYQGLNLGNHVGDDPKIVQQNRDWLVQHAAMPSAPVWLNQTHSTHVATVNQPTSMVLDADGTFTEQTGIVCSAMTADCLPVLLTNTQGTQVAAVHAGWRGLANGIVEQALSHFSGDVIAWLGPAIGATAFEVGEDVLNAFTKINPQAEQAFQLIQSQLSYPQLSQQSELSISASSHESSVQKWYANMSQLASQRLQSAGVELIFDSNLCTYNNPDRFYSYRRDGITGRQACFIWLED